MKAIRFDRFGGREVLRYVEVPDPEPGHEQLLVQATAIELHFPDARERLGVCKQSETRVVRGVIVLDPNNEMESKP